MFSDFSCIFYYWLAVFLIGLAFYPLSSYLFQKFWDRGYIFSKILGIGVSSYIVWVLASLRILTFSRSTIILVVGILAILNWWMWWAKDKKRDARINEQKHKKWIWIWEEGVFGLSLALWSYVRGFAPDINGLEKFMDYGFVNSILRSNYFPPLDMWLSGKNFINYYYFGHYYAAFLTKLTGIASEITYNLQLGLIFGLSIVAGFSLISNFLYHRFKTMNFRIFLGSFIGALLLNIGGNLHTIVYVIKKGLTTYWYPDATRFIPYTIHEFPSYSYVVADLHGHLSDVPFVMLVIGLVFSLFLFLANSSKGLFLEAFKEKKRVVLYPFIIILLLGLFLAINYMSNAWDLPIYLALSGLSFFAIRIKMLGFGKKAFIDSFIFGFLMVGLYLFFSLPFNFYFKPFFKGIAVVEAKSPFYMLAILWGYFYFFAISMLFFSFGKKIRESFGGEELVKKIAKFYEVKVKIVRKEKRVELKIHIVDVFIAIMIGLATFLIVFPEFFYVKDIYIKEYHRANTVFKLTYQSFMMLSMVAGFTLASVLVKKKSKLRSVWLVVSFLVIVSVLIYPYFSVGSYYNKLRNYRGLDGISYLKNKYPGDHEAIMWLRGNAKKNDVIVEAVGESYTDYGRISSYTGLQTVLGWPVHEWLWRGSYDEAGKRTGDVAVIYTGDLATAKNFLKNYGVDYVIVGKLEKDKYSKINEANFKKLGKMVFNKGETKIYKIGSN